MSGDVKDWRVKEISNNQSITNLNVHSSHTCGRDDGREFIDMVTTKIIAKYFTRYVNLKGCALAHSNNNSHDCYHAFIYCESTEYSEHCTVREFPSFYPVLTLPTKLATTTKI